MKKLTLLLVIVVIVSSSASAQFLIQATTPVDVCYPNTVTLQVAFPQAGYDYNWFLGGYGCPNVGSAGPYAFGTSMQAMITGEYYCMEIPTGGGLPQISNPITVRVLPGMPGSIYMPAPGLYGGSTSCVASAPLCISTIYYQNWPGTIIKWYKNNVLISGASSGSYTATTTGYYKYTITSGCMTAPSDSTLVTTVPIASISATGATTFCSGGNVILNANTGIGMTYQWKLNTGNISGATNSTYTATSAGSYTVVVTSSCGTVTSSAISVTVNTLPSATITPGGPTTFCTGGSVTLNAPVAANRTYQWKKGANLVAGATLPSYSSTTGGNYRVIVTNTVTGCSKTTASATVVTVNALPAATISPQGPTTFCAGGSVVLQANTGAGITYKWKKGSNFISGATLSNYTAAAGGNYRVQVTNSNGCSKVSAAVTVSVPCRENENVEAVEEKSALDVKVYPNPGSGDFVFEIHNAEANKISVIVYDMIGKKVSSEEFNYAEFYTLHSAFPAGIYAAEISCGKYKKVIKLVKK